MEYEPQTTAPIAPNILLRAAQVVADKNYLGNDLVYTVFVDRGDNWDEVGVDIFLKEQVSNPSDMEMGLFEGDYINPEFELDVAAEQRKSFHDELTRLVNSMEINAPYDAVVEQIKIETDNFSDSVDFDYNDIFKAVWEGIEEFAEKVGLSVEELAEFTTVLTPNSVPQDYLVFHNPKEFVDYIIDEELDEEDLFDYMNDGEFDENYYEEHGLDDKALEFLYGQSMEDLHVWANKTLTVELHDGIMISYIG